MHASDALCRGHGPGDLANITHLASDCGLLYGSPRRKDESSSFLFDPGFAWRFPMYSCLSTAKATIKAVSFRFNSTNDDLSSLEIVSLADKTYLNEESKPLWGVKNSNIYLKGGGPLWGLISLTREKELNLSTMRKESLYLPGHNPIMGTENVTGADFAATALQMTYDTIPNAKTATDYTGKANLAMYKKWQGLSKTPETSAKIINLIWTDVAANVGVGTKGLQQHEDGGAVGVRYEPVPNPQGCFCGDHISCIEDFDGGRHAL